MNIEIHLEYRDFVIITILEILARFIQNNHKEMAIWWMSQWNMHTANSHESGWAMAHLQKLESKLILDFPKLTCWKWI